MVGFNIKSLQCIAGIFFKCLTQIGTLQANGKFIRKREFIP